MLELQGVTKTFGGLVAVQDVDLRVPPGLIYGLIGPNGAGKTTAFNIITGIYKPTSGHILFDGRDITGVQPHRAAQMGIARTFQNIRLFSQLSVFQNVLMSVQLRAKYTIGEAVGRFGRFRAEEKALEARANELLELVKISHRAKMRANELPYGEQRKVEIARALALNPKLLLLDEPAAGMNPDESIRLSEFIEDIHYQFGLTTVMIEHHMDVAMGICERITVLDFGRVIADGTPEEVQTNEGVIEAYLGTKWEAV
ncbi:MAG: ABC transporter ATP-binding protein [Bacillota bacterium]